jgi:hypothetical protein
MLCVHVPARFLLSPQLTVSVHARVIVGSDARPRRADGHACACVFLARAHAHAYVVFAWTRRSCLHAWRVKHSGHNLEWTCTRTATPVLPAVQCSDQRSRRKCVRINVAGLRDSRARTRLVTLAPTAGLRVVNAYACSNALETPGVAGWATRR